MYQPRRVAEPSEFSATVEYSDYAAAAAANPGPRRARQGFGDKVRARVTPTAVAMAMTTGAAAFVVVPSFTGSDSPSTAVPAENRMLGNTSRDQVRPLADTLPAEAEAEGDEEAQVEEAGSEESPVAETEDPVAEEAEISHPVAEEVPGGSHAVSENWAKSFAQMAGTQYAKDVVVVREEPSSKSDKIGSLKLGEAVQVTDRVTNGYREVVYKKRLAYVYDLEISKNKPSEGGAGAATGTLYPGQTSSTNKYGLTDKAMVVYNAVMSRWGGRIKAVGGYRKHSLSVHQYGRAIDFMLTPHKDSEVGWAMARYLAANHTKYGIDHIIFEQKIWTPYRKTWRHMASRGSITANHWDHVHVAIKP